MGYNAGDRVMKALVLGYVSGVVLLLLPACSSHRDVIQLDYDPTVPIMPNKPTLPIKSLNENSGPDEVMKAYVATVVIQKSYIDEVNYMIDSL